MSAYSDMMRDADDGPPPPELPAGDYPPPAPHTEGLPRRARRPSPEVRANRSFAWGMLTGFVIATLVMWGALVATEPPPVPVPPCTDAIAEARGICHGPLLD